MCWLEGDVVETVAVVVVLDKGGCSRGSKVVGSMGSGVEGNGKVGKLVGCSSLVGLLGWCTGGIGCEMRTVAWWK